MPASSSVGPTTSGNSFGDTSGSMNPLEVVTIAVVGIIFAIIIVSAFKK